jgi:hypothetical protein
MRNYEYPVYATQGGGLVREISGQYFFIEKPDCPGLDIGDEMPKDWGIVPANHQARREERDNFDPMRFGEDVGDFFDTLLREAKAGDIGLDQVRRFFPEGERNV